MYFQEVFLQSQTWIILWGLALDFTTWSDTLTTCGGRSSLTGKLYDDKKVSDWMEIMWIFVTHKVGQELFQRRGEKWSYMDEDGCSST